MDAQDRFDFQLTPEEVRTFEYFRNMEAVHNELGHFLSTYKDTILTERNRFVIAMCKKYRIQKPNLATYDPSKKRIVSILDPTLQASRMGIEIKPPEFTQMASKMMYDAIRSLTGLITAFRKGT